MKVGKIRGHVNGNTMEADPSVQPNAQGGECIGHLLIKFGGNDVQDHTARIAWSLWIIFGKSIDYKGFNSVNSLCDIIDKLKWNIQMPT